MVLKYKTGEYQQLIKEQKVLYYLNNWIWIIRQQKAAYLQISTREEISERRRQAFTGPPEHFHLFGLHPVNFVLIV